MKQSVSLMLSAVFLSFCIVAEWCYGQEPPSTIATSEQREFDIGFIGLHGGVYEQLLRFAPALDLKLRYFEDAEIESGKAELASVRVLYLQHTRAEDRDRYKQIFTEAKSKNSDLVVIAFQSSTADLFASLGLDGVLTDDPQAAKYYGNTPENLRRLLVYSGKTYLSKDWTIELPEESERQGLYHPDSPKQFGTAQEFIVWLRSLDRIRPQQPRLLITVHGTHLAFQQPAVVDALIREAERQGAVAAAIVDGRSKNYETEAAAFEPSAIIHTCHSMDALPMRLKLDVPHLHSIFIRKQSIGQFQTSEDGLSGSELAFHVIGQELLGAIEPQVGGGTRGGQGSSETIEPIPDRIEHLISRALAYANLRARLPEEKRIAIVYYDREMGKGELMRGSSTGMHMNAPRSLLNVLAKMKEHGYKVDPLPKFENELLSWMMERGRQIGVWAPAELDKMVKHGSPTLIPTDQYLRWYNEKIPADRRAQMEQRWGPPPGKFMVWSNGKEQFIVVPRIELGNVVLLPQPLRGELHGKETANSQTHDKVTTPPHNYMATYFWLEQAYGADAVVHFGTHGSEFALPGKPSGLSQRDWPDILMGKMPNFNPWIIENMVESSPVKRRVYGTLISHLPPPIVDAGLSDDLENLHESLDKWEMLEEGALREGFRKEITKLVLAGKLDVDLKLNLPESKLFDDEQLREVGKYLHDIKEETTPVSLHVFGEPPREDLLIPYLVQILRQPFLSALDQLLHDSSLADPKHRHSISLPAHAHDANGQHELRPLAEQLVELVVRRGVEPKLALGTVLGREVMLMPEEIEKGLKLAVDLSEAFRHTTDEVDNLLRGLDGRFVPPGPGNSPIRNPSAVPTGRNMYLLNPEEVPTKPSWELGVKLVKEMIETHTQKHGTPPTKIGFDLRSGATFRDYGVMESQILYLMGVQPVWDERQLVNDVKLIPREQLGRPRIDVFIAAGGWYESNLPSRLQLWDKAVRLVAQAEEEDNLIRGNSQATEQQLIQRGIPAERAKLLSRGRIFGVAPGNETPRMLAYRVAQSGDWENREQIADAYLASHKNIFTEGAWGESAEAAYDVTIQGTHTVVRSWSDHMTSPLASRYTWLHGGALSLAVERMTGKRPEYIFSDVRDPDKTRMVDAEDALKREYHVRLFNRKWLEGMMKEGYSGADHMRFLVANSFAWEVMRPGSVGSHNWDEMKQVIVDDKLNLGLRDWFDKNNPYAIQDAMASMLEASRKGYWLADSEQLSNLAQNYAANIAKNGMSGHMTSGGNQRLHEMVRGLLQSAGSKNANLLARYDKRFNDQTEIPSENFATSRAMQDNAEKINKPTSKASETLALTEAAPASPSATVASSSSTSASTEVGNNSSDLASTTEGARATSEAPQPSIPKSVETTVSGKQLVASPETKPTGDWISSRIWLLGLGVLAVLVLGLVKRRSF